MERKTYIDVAKGILMILVVIGHTIDFKINGADDVYNTEFLEYAYKLWDGFYMQAFFLITGYCSNFTKDWGKYCKDNARTILLPILFLQPIICMLNVVRYRNFSDFGDTLLEININYWFLLALFVSKTLYWHIRKLRTAFKVSLFLSLYVFGAVAYNYNLNYNIWYIYQSCLLMVFLYIGDIFKAFSIQRKHIVCSAIIYSCFMLAHYMWNLETPVIASCVHINWSNIIFSIPFSVSGSILFFELCKLINKNQYIEYIGKNSLPLFVLHLTILLPIIEKFHNIIYHDYVAQITTVIFVLLCVMAIVYLLNTKKLKWMLGKF